MIENINVNYWREDMKTIGTEVCNIRSRARDLARSDGRKTKPWVTDRDVPAASTRRRESERIWRLCKCKAKLAERMWWVRETEKEVLSRRKAHVTFYSTRHRSYFGYLHATICPPLTQNTYNGDSNTDIDDNYINHNHINHTPINT